MKLPSLLSLGVAASTTIVAAVPDQKPIGDTIEDVHLGKFLIELGPGDTRWVTEEEKWGLRRVCFSVPLSTLCILLILL